MTGLKKSLLFVVSLGFNLSAANARPTLHGGVGDGGGEGIVCRNSDGTVQSAKVLDLVEAEFYHKLSISQDIKELSYLELAIAKANNLDNVFFGASPFSEHLYSDGRKEYDISLGLIFGKANNFTLINNNIAAIDAGKKMISGDAYAIPAVGDSNPLVEAREPNCKLEQIAIYNDGNKQVHFVENVWNALDNQNKAALLLHEAIYAIFRDASMLNSDYARKIVGYAFAGYQFEWLLDGLANSYVSCWTTDVDHSFKFVAQNAGEKIQVFFTEYDGEVQISKLDIFVSPVLFPILSGVNLDNVTSFTEVHEVKSPLVKRKYVAFTRMNVNGEEKFQIEVLDNSDYRQTYEVQCKDRFSHLN